MDQLTGSLPPPVPSYMQTGVRFGRHAVAQALDGGAVDSVAFGADAEQSLAAANYLGNVMFIVQIANGLHPRSAVDFVTEETRGGELARGFLTAGTVEICCDYCGQLLAISLAGAAAMQLRAVHGSEHAPGQWDALSFALTGPPV